MKLENIKQITVIGAGAMGAQITQLLSLVGGYSITINDVKDAVSYTHLTLPTNREV